VNGAAWWSTGDVDDEVGSEYGGIWVVAGSVSQSQKSKVKGQKSKGKSERAKVKDQKGQGTKGKEGIGDGE
jgi:hypothetical protein